MKEGWEERSDLPPHQVCDLIRLVWRWGKKRAKLLALGITFNSCPLVTLTKWVPSSYLLRCWFISRLCLPRRSLTTNCPGLTDHKEPRTENAFNFLSCLLGCHQHVSSGSVRTTYHSAWRAVRSRYLLTKWINKNIPCELVWRQSVSSYKFPSHGASLWSLLELPTSLHIYQLLASHWTLQLFNVIHTQQLGVTFLF